MKNIAIITGLLIMLMAGNSCNKDLLETQPTDKYNEGNFWESEAAVEAALSGCYNPLTTDGLFGGDATPLWEETATPNAYNYSNAMGFNLIAEGRQQSSNGGIIAQRWHDSYVGVGRCNTFLANVDRVEMSETTKARMKGEARFLRGLYYFMLENYYGGVPLILEEPNPDTQSDLPRTPREEVVAQIIKDLDSAALVLPAKKYTGGNVGRATKGAALALKARVLLYEASPLFNPSNDLAKWKAAADAAKAVMDLTEAGYGLYDDYRGLFLPQNENNKEVIFDVQYIFPGLGTSFDLIGKQYNTNAPLLDLAQAYHMNNGLPITNPLSGYNSAKPYENRDPRLYGTIFFPGDTLMQVPVDEERFAVTGFGMKKYTIYDKGPAPAGQSDLKSGQSETNFIILRYADILLMYAEAMNEFAGPAPAVYDALNEVRQRESVNMPPLLPVYSQAELREIIHHERRIELAGEALYYNDIRRWKTAEVVLNAPIYTYAGSQIEVRTFDPARDYFWPIPLTETDLNPALEQNPKY